jgi:cell pole-organizing protein PopZ
MSEQAAPEPTMEEILASIRRIISEDDAPPGETEAEAAPAPAAEAEPEPAPAAPEVEPEPIAAAAEPEPAEDVLELTERVEPETVGDLAVYADQEPAPKPAPAAAPAPAPRPAVSADEGAPLMSETSAIAAASAFTNLSAAIPLPAVGRTLEDLTRELLRPLLKAWLDENLPRIVEAKVAEEVERIARLRVR